MRTAVLSRLLRQEYQQRFDSARKCLLARQEMVAQSVRKILSNRTRYERLTKSTTMPWYFLAIIHGLEADFRFDAHLHNGDPLTARTVRVPAGRPAQGKPPFSWEESAMDAIAVNRYDKWNDWSIAGMLVVWERYNGLGYRHYGVNSPYVWACTDLYAKGRYRGRRKVRCQCRIQAMRCGRLAEGADRDGCGITPGGSEIGCNRVRAHSWKGPDGRSAVGPFNVASTRGDRLTFPVRPPGSS